jgi:hypothetical protein
MKQRQFQVPVEAVIKFAEIIEENAYKGQSQGLIQMKKNWLFQLGLKKKTVLQSLK